MLAISPHIHRRHRYFCRTVKSTSRNHPGKNLCPASEESSSQHVAPLHLSLSFQDHQRLGGMGGQLYPRYHVHLNDVEASQLTRNEKKIKSVTLHLEVRADSILGRKECHLGYFSTYSSPASIHLSYRKINFKKPSW
ncbi:hypothetical protein AVEN_209841-1 [Araneus ventricosus]|uniref:Uncharacterized protein n=1 Tax=Araneus ventricosus TaxID=182803 RepID=A0A4Y2DP59_ARAVE|nr:hypothetical protein AVEN_37425-1 [Araneus ventricosus]GBM17614.1 hypothetical protein AVEN_89918-1 [Araneus ventricosus]GBM17628.1 hypothetical protein AVEN_155509-1 [Araneus ventricosus]GBM17637.1 hypothetical protein AVEN_209841-1 [Araneus ventricosus]